MVDLVIERLHDSFAIRFGELSHVIPIADLGVEKARPENFQEDPISFGIWLHSTILSDEMQEALASIPENSYLRLVTEDPILDSIPWEYLRDNSEKLVAGRLNFVRGLRNRKRTTPPAFSGAWELLIMPVTPMAASVRLNTEYEWESLSQIALKANRAVKLTRVRPPTLTSLQNHLGNTPNTLVWFMGHSTVDNGHGRLAFDDGRGGESMQDAVDFATVLDPSVRMVLMNSCLSASGSSQTAFGNVARALTERGVPYAMGMQFTLPDMAAIALSSNLLHFLLLGKSIEEAVRRTRIALLSDKNPTYGAWLAGNPVLYTNQETPVRIVKLSTGKATITPSPRRIINRTRLEQLPTASAIIGRRAEIIAIHEALQEPRQADFVVLHGLFGTGKTLLARVIAEQIACRYDDFALAISFEGFSRIDDLGALVVDPNFLPSMLQRMARHLGIRSSAQMKQDALENEVLRRLSRRPGLLVLDRLETLIAALRRRDRYAEALAGFVRKLLATKARIIMTSQHLPPAEWGRRDTIPIKGLTIADGGRLFSAFLSTPRAHDATIADPELISRKLSGHPQGLLHLARIFEHQDGNFSDLVARADELLLHDEHNSDLNQRIARCLAWLDAEEMDVMNTVAQFQAPVSHHFVAAALDNRTSVSVLARLTGLSVLDVTETFGHRGTLEQFAVPPVIRSHLHNYQPESLTKWSVGGDARIVRIALTALQSILSTGDVDVRLRVLVRDSLADVGLALMRVTVIDQEPLAQDLALSLIDTANMWIGQESVASSSWTDRNDSTLDPKPTDCLPACAKALLNIAAILDAACNHDVALKSLWTAYKSFEFINSPQLSLAMDSILSMRNALSPSLFDAQWSRSVTDCKPTWLQDFSIDDVRGSYGGETGHRSELVIAAIDAIRGGPHLKMQLARRLSAESVQTTDLACKAFLLALQLALFGGDLQAHGQSLSENHRESWDAIVLGVMAGDRAEVLTKIAGNTRAVLGPVANQKAEWRNEVLRICNHAIANNNLDFAKFLEVVARLLDANGNPTGLGAGLRGMYAEAWRQLTVKPSTNKEKP